MSRSHARFAIPGLAVGAAVACFVLLALGRLTWGLPSAERLRFYPADHAIMDAPQASRFYMTSPIESLHPDEGAILNALSNMRPDRFDFNPRYFNYPSFHIYTIGAVLKGLQLLGAIELRSDKSFYFQNPAAMARIYLAGRVVTLAYGIAAILLVALIAGALTGSRNAGALAALLLAITPYWVRDSTYLLPNVPAATLATAVVWLTLAGARRQSGGWLMTAAAVAGLAAGTKYPAGALLLFPMAATFVGRADRSALQKLRTAATQAVVAGTVFLLTTPYAVVTPAAFLQGMLFEAGDKLAGSGFATSWTALAVACGPFLGAAFILAMGFVTVTDGRTAAILGFWFLLAALNALLSGRIAVRYWLPVLPVVAVVVAVAIDRARAVLPRMVVTPAVASLVAVTVVLSVTLNAQNANNDPRLAAARWIEATIPGDQAIATRRIYFDRPPINSATHQVRWLDQDTCNTPGAWHVTAEPFNGPLECPAPSGATVFANPPLMLSWWPGFARTEDVIFSNIRIVIYPPT